MERFKDSLGTRGGRGSRAAVAVFGAVMLHGCQAAPPPDRDIVYTSASEAQPEQIWRMRPDGSEPHPVTQAVEGRHESFAVWSPDGSSIVFLSNRDGGGQTSAIFSMNPDGTNVRRIGPEHLPFQVAPAFSPDGTRIVFAGGPQIVFEGGAPVIEVDLYVMNTDGSELERLTQLNAFVSCPRWSPDGGRVLFSTNLDQLRVVDVVSGRISEILPAGVEGGCGDWSPDGTKLAFSSGPDRQLPSVGEMTPGTFLPQELYVLDLADGRLEHFPQAGVQSNYPRWSRDGQRIVFQCAVPPGAPRGPDFVDRPGMFEICVMNADGSDPRPITHNSVLDVHPNW